MADHAAHVFAVGAGLGAEAGGGGGEGDAAFREVDGFVAEEVGERDFGGGDEPVVVVLELAWDVGAFVVGVKEVFGEFGEAAGAEEGAGVDEGGWEDLDVAVLAGVEVEHEVGKCAFEAGAGAKVDDEAGAGDFGGALEVENAEGLAEFPVGLGGKGEGAGFAPGFNELILVLGGAWGDVVGGEVGEGFEEGAEFGIGFGGSSFEGVCAGLEGGGLLADGGRVGSGFFELAELLGEGVALSLEGFGLGDGGAAVGVEGGEVLEEGGVCAA